MLHQCSLFDEPPPGLGTMPLARPPRLAIVPGRVHSLFYALVPSPADAVRLHAHARWVEEQFGFARNATDADRLHVTLHALGAHAVEPPDAKVDRWCRAASAVRQAPFEVVFDRIAAFGGRDNAWVFTSSDDAALHALHEALGIALANTGERIVRQRIAPHMTVSWRGRRIPETPIEPVRWLASEVVLIDSHHGEHEHEVLGRWTLTG